MAEKDDLIIFLGSGKLFCSDGEHVWTFDLPESFVKDWDVVDKENLQDSLGNLIDSNNIAPSEVTLVISESACFSTDLHIQDGDKLEEAEREFLEAVPFNYVISKKYKINEGARVISANKDLVDDILEVFEGRGFPIFSVVPAAIFPKQGTKNVLDMEFIKAINNNRDLITTSNMITPKPAVAETHGPAVTTGKASSGFLPYLIGVAVFAVIVLAVLIILRR